MKKKPLNTEVRFLISAIIAILVASPCHAGSKTLLEAGNIGQIALPFSAALISLWKDDHIGFFQEAEGLIYTEAVVQGLKFSVHEKRPNGNNYQSFPSGHTASAFQAASYLQFRYGASYGLPAYAVASMVGFSRVNNQKHYWHDVAAGAAIATGIQYLITEKSYSLSQFFIAPYTDEHTRIGLVGGFSW